MPVESSDNPVAVGTAPCCANSDPGSKLQCSLCESATCKNCRSFVNGRRVCVECKSKIQDEVNAEQAGGGHFMVALAGGVTAAVVSGALWAFITIVTHFVIGYMAVGVGYLAGYGVYWASGKKRGLNLQCAAVASALFGLVLGKYFIVAYILSTSDKVEISMFNPLMIIAFFSVLPEMLSPFDILWVFIALNGAWSIPKPTAVNIRG